MGLSTVIRIGTEFAVVGELRQDERHLALPHRGAVGERPHVRVQGIDLRERRARNARAPAAPARKSRRFIAVL